MTLHHSILWLVRIWTKVSPIISTADLNTRSVWTFNYSHVYPNKVRIHNISTFHDLRINYNVILDFSISSHYCTHCTKIAPAEPVPPACPEPPPSPPPDPPAPQPLALLPVLFVPTAAA